MRRRLIQELLIAGLFFLLPLIAFWPQTVGGRTLLPVDNLYQYAPYDHYREQVGVPEQPHNPLLDDLILQNYQWKHFIRESVSAGEVPLWNPHQFGGAPFLAAGQQSAFYPLSIVYYVLPLPVAYGWFTVLTLWLAGWFMSAFLRVLIRDPEGGPFGGIAAGVTYQLGGFFIASAVHPMILGAAAWLPALLLMAELILRRTPLLGRATAAPWVALGAVALAFNIFAGHPELTIYTLLIVGYFSAGRLIWRWHSEQRPDFAGAAWLLAMVALGFALGGVQFIPLFDVASDNWRTQRDSLETVLGFAHPPRDLIQYLLPNFYGSPAHHSVFDWFKLESMPVTTNVYGDAIRSTDWGIKNYVEAALYVGVLPLALAAYALIAPRRGEADGSRWVFATLTVVALTFMFGLPTYAVVYALPGINQLNTAFRWVYGVTTGVAVLAGMGAAALVVAQQDARALRRGRWLGRSLLALGLLTLGGLLASWAAYGAVEPLVERVFTGMAGAQSAFPDVQTFYNYQFTNVLIFGVVLVLGGVGVLALLTDAGKRHARLMQTGVVGLIAVDLLIASWGFNPAADPDWLDFKPESVAWLQARQQAEGPFRFTTLEDPAGGQDRTFQANATMRYGLDDLRGYESIISAGTVTMLNAVQPQTQLDFNRVSPLYLDRAVRGEVNWDRLALYNVRYVVAQNGLGVPDGLPLEPVHRTAALTIYRFSQAAGAAFWMAGQPDEAPTIDATQHAGSDGLYVERRGSRETVVTLDLSMLEDAGGAWLLLSENYAPGWRAFVRPLGVDEDGDRADERALDLRLAAGGFPGVYLNAADLADRWEPGALSVEQAQAVAVGRYEVRFVYSPMSFQVGAFATVIGVALVIFLLALWFWGAVVGSGDDSQGDAGRVARNSVAPILLNLFNRGIDFAFAFVMLRILGPEDAGIYYYAVVVFVWFDIFTNFGLDVFLIREASRERARAGFLLLNTSAMRLMLVVAGVPLLVGFLIVRQSTIEPTLNAEALLAIGLLYIGLAPASISKGLTSIFYAYQKAEYPAAVATITTINKAALGLLALLLGYGIVGLAGVSILVNVVTLGVLTVAALRVMRPDAPAAQEARLRPDPGLMRGMARESWPLMLNHFLATIFFQIDVVILEALKGARIVGQYSVAYRWLLAINIVPAFFTQALLPVMSRQASDDRDALRRTYTLGVKLLVALAVPLAVAFTFMAEGLTLFLGGAAFMPNGAIALQIMIWSIPFGWMNSLTQYALIAVDRQRAITRAFALAVTFNIVSNLLLIPTFGFRAAAVTTIFSEMVLLLPFALLMQDALGRFDWADMVWRPAVSGGVMLALTYGLWGVSPLLALAVGASAYGAALLLLRPLSATEWGMIAPVLPGRLRRAVAS